MTTLSYKPANDKWHMDVNIHWYGEQFLEVIRNCEWPVHKKLEEIWKSISDAKTFSIFDRSSQSSVGKIHLVHTLIQASVWGPTRGREFYIGGRVIIK